MQRTHASNSTCSSVPSAAAPLVSLVSLGHGFGRELERYSDDWWTIVVNMNTLMGIENPRKARFPGPLCVALKRADIRRVFFSGQDYVMTYKTDGGRVMALFTRLHAYPVLAIVDRSLRVLLVPFEAPALMYDGLGTLLDGEIVRTEHCCLLEVFDVVSLFGDAACSKWYYTQRLDLGVELVRHFSGSSLQQQGHPELELEPEPEPCERGDGAEAESEREWERELAAQYASCGQAKKAGGSAIWWNRAEGACFHVVIKPVFGVQKMRHIRETIFGRLPFRCDGTVYAPIAQPVRPMHCPDMFKQKDPLDNTCDFFVKLLPPYHASEQQQQIAGAHAPGARAFALRCPPLEPALSIFQMPLSADDCARLSAAAGSEFCAVSLGVCVNGTRDVQWFSDAWLRADLVAEFTECVVECRWDPERAQWTLQNVRGDCLYPNSLNTVRNNCSNIVENMDWRELCCEDDVAILHPSYASPFATGPDGPVRKQHAANDRIQIK